MDNETRAILISAFINSGYLKPPKHEWYDDIFGGGCYPNCAACEIERKRKEF